MPYNWKIELNSEDITDKVSDFEISHSLERFCREMTIGITDKALYDSLDFSQVSESPEIEIFTKIASTWFSQGTFFIERPALAQAVKSDLMQGVWGRSLTAKLDEPFAPKVTKTWDTQTSFFAICQEVCDLAGITWNPAYCLIDDFTIYANTYEADGLYPIQVITELAEFAGAVVTTDRLGHVCIKRIDYAPASEDVTILDDDIREMSEEPEWPTFGNRIKIAPTGSMAGYSVDLIIPNECLHADGTSKAKMFAQVRNEEDEPVNGVVVEWSHDSDTANLEPEESNTQEVMVQNERQKSTGFYTVDVDITPSEVDGIWAYTDQRKINNFASGGYSIDGNTITLVNKLDFCDQSLVISYRANGMAINYLQAGSEADDVTVTADVEGQQDTGMVYIENPCACPATITLTAIPSSIMLNEVAKLLVYVEESGPVTTGRMVYMRESGDTEHGELDWGKARLGKVTITNEQTSVRNEIAGLAQCEISMYPDSIISVYRDDGDGHPTGTNIYGSRDGKTLNLTTALDTGTGLLVNYRAVGAALNLFTGEVKGDATFIASIKTTSEEGTEASAEITITEYDESYDEDDEDGDYGGYGGSDDYGYDLGKDEDLLCRKSDGTRVECGEGESCCTDGHTVGCHPTEDCVGGSFNPCYPSQIDGEVTEEALMTRFDTGKNFGCSCEEMCQKELDLYGTTQSFDEGSGRKISEIVVDDYGLEEGSPEYWEKKDELETEAIEECIEECNTCDPPLALDDESTPDSIDPGGSIEVYVTGVGEFTFSTSSYGYYFNAGLTEKSIVTSDGHATLFCSPGECGDDFDPYCTVEVTDFCGATITFDIRGDGVWGDWITQYETFYNEYCSGNCDPLGSSGPYYWGDGGSFQLRYYKGTAWVGGCSQGDPNDCCGDGAICGHGLGNHHFLCFPGYEYKGFKTGNINFICAAYWQKREWTCPP